MDIDYVPIKANMTHTEWKSIDSLYDKRDPPFAV